jgi:hypothetical protein
VAKVQSFENKIVFSSPDGSGILLRLPAFERLEALKDRANSRTKRDKKTKMPAPKKTTIIFKF